MKCFVHRKYEILSAIWYHLYNFGGVKNTREGVLLLVKLQTFQLVFHVFWIMQMLSNRATHHICMVTACWLASDSYHHIKTIHLICTENQMIDFCMECNAGLKSVNSFRLKLLLASYTKKPVNWVAVNI